MRSAEILILPFTTFAALIAVVACGPSRDYVPVTPVPPTAFAKAANECRTNIRASQTISIGHDHEKAPKVKVCSFAPQVSTEEMALGKYSLNEQPVSYTLSKNKRDRLTLSLKIGMSLPEQTSRETRVGIGEVLNQICRERITEIFKRSLRSGGVETDFAYDYGTAGISEQADKGYNQILDLGVVQTVDPSDVAFAMLPFADGAKLYPHGKASEIARCKAIRSPDGQRVCLKDARVTANLPFCQQLTKMTAIWLGLSDQKLESKRCDSPVAESAPRKSQFLNAATDLPPQEFFEKAKLDVSEVASIFSRGCPSFANLK